MKMKLRSKQIPLADVGQAEIVRYYRKTLLKSIGYTNGELDQPLVAVVNTWSEISPGHFHLKQVAENVKSGIRTAGGTPAELVVSGLCDGLSVGSVADKYSLPYRDVTAAYIETMVEANMFDGMVLIATCDKVVPACLIATARINIPSIIVTGGYMQPGRFKGKPLVMSDVVEGYGSFKTGMLSDEEFKNMVNLACPGPGACPLMGTANTMCCITEALGLSLPGNAATPATSARLLHIAKEAGKQIISLINQEIKPSVILKKEAFENAIKVCLAIGGSTNAILHLAAIASEVEVAIELDLWDKLSRETPLICGIKPTTPELTMQDLDEAGGLQAVMKELEPLLHTSVLTVTGKTLADNLKIAKNFNPRVIRPLSQPLYPEGGIAILKGNLAPNGAVVKPATVAPQMLKHKGPAKVFNSEEEAMRSLMVNEIKRGDVVVIRYEGPKGGPGMRQMQFFLQLLNGMELEDSVVLITDGRFSGTNRGGAIGHVMPEAAEGGPIAVIQDDDIIEIDIPNRRLNVKLTDAEIKERLSRWRPPPLKIKKGILALYAKCAEPVDKGAGLKTRFNES